MIEIIFKVVVQLVFICFFVFPSIHLWKSQIDVKGIGRNFFKQFTEKSTDWMLTRDPKAIYQNDIIVGNVTGDVKEENGKIVFTEIINTDLLNINNTIEYKRSRLRIIDAGSSTGMSGIASDVGSEVKLNIREGVICQKI